MAETPGLDFVGKVVHVYIRPGAMDANAVVQYVVVNPRFVEQTGRLFLVGETFESKDNPPWHAGAAVGVLWESVSCFLVFESHEAYEAAYNRVAAQATKSATESAPPEPHSLWPFRRASP